MSNGGYMTSNNVGDYHDHSMSVGGNNYYDLWMGSPHNPSSEPANQPLTSQPTFTPTDSPHTSEPTLKTCDQSTHVKSYRLTCDQPNR
eukprot:UN08012